MVAKLKWPLLLLAVILINAGIAIGVQYTVLYTNLAQTISVQHTWNPSTASTAPFLIGANATEVEVADLRSELATRLAANPANCAPAGALAAGVDASGVAEGCATNIATATALAANGANCASGEFAAGVDASGAAEGCGTAEDKFTFGFPNTTVLSFCYVNGVTGTTTMTCSPDTLSGTGTGSLFGADADQGAMINRGASTLGTDFGDANTAKWYFGNRAIRYSSLIRHMDTAKVRYWWGLTNCATTTQFDSDTPNCDYAMFRASVDASDTTYRCITASDNVNITNTDSTVTWDTATHTYNIDINSAGTQVRFYIDGTLRCTHTTNLPDSASVLKAQNGGEKRVDSTGTVNYRIGMFTVEGDK